MRLLPDPALGEDHRGECGPWWGRKEEEERKRLESIVGASKERKQVIAFSLEADAERSVDSEIDAREESEEVHLQPNSLALGKKVTMSVGQRAYFSPEPRISQALPW